MARLFPFLWMGLAACGVYSIVGAELFWGSLLVAVGVTYLSRSPFIWILLGLMTIGGLLTEPIVFTVLVIGFGCSFQMIKT